MSIFPKVAIITSRFIMTLLLLTHPALHPFIYSRSERVPVCINQKAGVHPGQVASQSRHIWYFICDPKPNKICQLRFSCISAMNCSPLWQRCDFFLKLTANGPLATMPCTAFKFSMRFLPGRWSGCCVRSIWTVDCNICMNYLSSRSAWKTFFSFPRHNLLHYNSSWQ